MKSLVFSCSGYSILSYTQIKNGRPAYLIARKWSK